MEPFEKNFDFKIGLRYLEVNIRGDLSQIQREHERPLQGVAADLIFFRFLSGRFLGSFFKLCVFFFLKKISRTLPPEI